MNTIIWAQSIEHSNNPDICGNIAPYICSPASITLKGYFLSKLKQSKQGRYTFFKALNDSLSYHIVSVSLSN